MDTNQYHVSNGAGSWLTHYTYLFMNILKGFTIDGVYDPNQYALKYTKICILKNKQVEFGTST